MPGPVFSNVNSAISYTENAAPVTLSGNLTITDSRVARLSPARRSPSPVAHLLVTAIF